MSSIKTRTLIVGDIHGCYRELKLLLEKVKFNPDNDRLISLGDLVHKGPKSFKVLEFFYKNGYEVLLGNHDEYFLRFLKGEKKSYSEGEKILEKIKIPKKKLIQWIEKFPYFIEEPDFIAVHAAFDPSKEHFTKSSKWCMTSARYFNSKTKEMISSAKNPTSPLKPWYHTYPSEKLKNKITVFGHWAQPLPRVYKNFRCVDTGCCYGGHLSCLILEEDKIVKVESQQEKKFNY